MVYAIADGEVFYISYNNWGAGNIGVFVKHKLSDGSFFLGLYGHIRTGVKVGDRVFAGKSFATIGPWSTGDHLHFGVVPGNALPPIPWGRMPCSSWPVVNNFVNPVQWIKTRVPISNTGHYADGYHQDGTSDAYVDAYNLHDPKIGWPIDHGGGTYVHKWQSVFNPSYRVWIQNFQGDMNASHYGTDGQTALILNDYDTPYKAYLVKEGFWGYYKNNDGPFSFGVPFTEEITQSYANSPHYQIGDPIKPGDTITVQKFKRIWDYGGVPQYNNERRTLIWKEGISPVHFSVGEFFINGESCAGACPRDGDQICYKKDSNPANDEPWPLNNVVVPTGTWFTKSGQYEFVLHNPDGSRKQGWGISVFINEGNTQFSGDAVYPPQNLQVAYLDSSIVNFNWEAGLDSGSSEVLYKIYRDGNLIGTTYETSYQDDNLSPATTYCYLVTATINGVESGASANLTVTTQQIISVPNVRIINDAITKEIVDNYPINSAYSFIFGQYPVEIYAWAEIEVSNVNINNLYWTFNNAKNGSAASGETIRVSLGGDRYIVYAVLYSTNTLCDGAYGTWTAKLRGVNGEILHAVNFSMGIKKPGLFYADNITSNQLILHWLENECSTGFVLYRNGQFLIETDKDTITYIDNDLSPGSTYIYQVAVKYEDEFGAYQSDFTNAEEVTTPNTILEAPQLINIKLQ